MQPACGRGRGRGRLSGGASCEAGRSTHGRGGGECSCTAGGRELAWAGVGAGVSVPPHVRRVECEGGDDDGRGDGEQRLVDAAERGGDFRLGDETVAEAGLWGGGRVESESEERVGMVRLTGIGRKSGDHRHRNNCSEGRWRQRRAAPRLHVGENGAARGVQLHNALPRRLAQAHRSSAGGPGCARWIYMGLRPCAAWFCVQSPLHTQRGCGA